MAYLYRLILLPIVLLFASVSANAYTAPYITGYRVPVWSSDIYTTPDIACAAWGAAYGATATRDNFWCYRPVNIKASFGTAAGYTCTIGGGTLSGTGAASVCSCPVGKVDNGSACVDACPAGLVVPISGPLPWTKINETPYASAPASLCMNNSGGMTGQLCTFNSSGIGIKSPSGVTTNGYAEWGFSQPYTSAGSTCTVSNLPSATAAPACAGQSGTVNGVAVCLATESAAEKTARADSVAAQAAAAASTAAAAAGATPAVAAAAAAAAGEAAKKVIFTGGTITSALSAGQAAGVSVTSSGGSTAGAPAAAAGAAAAAAAGAAATAAGATAPQVAAAQAAAQAAAEGVIVAGGNSVQAAAAGSAAGANTIAGLNPTQVAAAAAGAAAAAAPGSTSAAAAGQSSEMGKFCADNPTSKLCTPDIDSKYSAGVCGSAPACEGDAIQCAIALESFKTSCALAPPSSVESALYDTSKGVTSAGLTTTAVVISSGSFSSEAVLGSGACIGDKTVVVAGKTVVLPFSDICPSLGYLKAVLLAVSYLVAASIVFRGGIA